MHHNRPPSPDTGPAGDDTLTDTALVPVASRHDGWTPERQRHFLETLADTGSVTAAAQAVGMSEQSARRLRRRADARAFDAAWEGALERAMQQLLPTAIDRALNGTLRQRYYHGELIAEERVHHDGLLLHLLERGAQSLGASRARRALRKNWDGSMAALEAGGPALGKAPKPISPAAKKKWRFEMIEDRWVTDAPYPLDMEDDALAIGDDDWRGWRYTTDEEADQLDSRTERWVQEQEASRRRFFRLT